MCNQRHTKQKTACALPHSLHQYLRIFVIVNITTYVTASAIMAPKKENTKKVAGNAKVSQHC